MLAFTVTPAFILALTLLKTTTTAQATTASSLPNVLIIQVLSASNGIQLGTLNGYGNFSSPGPSFPFRSGTTDSTSPDAEGGVARRTIIGYNYIPCVISTTGTLACGGDVEGENAEFYTQDGLLALVQSGTAFSVDAQSDEAGGKNANGIRCGIPVHVGNTTAVFPVVLRIKKARG